MDTFSYLSVLFSVILGLAVTEVLQGFRRLIVARKRVRFYMPLLIWMGVILLILVQDWWAMFGMRGIQTWTFGMYATVLLLVTLLYLVTGVCTPDIEADGSIDMRESYFAHSRWLFALFAAAVLASVFKSVTVYGQLPPRGDLLFHAAFFVFSVSAAVTKSHRYHAILAPVMAAVFVVYIVLYFTRL